MFSVRRRKLCATAVLAAGTVLAGTVVASLVFASPVFASPVFASPVFASPVVASPVVASTVLAGEGLAAPGGGQPGLDLTKTASPQTYTHVGDRITYTYTVTNTRHFTLHDVHVTDDRVSGPIPCTPSTIAIGKTATCTASYTITRADVRRRQVTNTATATGRTRKGDVTSGPADATVRLRKEAAIRLVKSAFPHVFSAPGQTIGYTYRVINVGGVTLFRITLTDNRLGVITCPRTTLAPGKSMTCTATYTTTRRDVRAGYIDNSAVVVGHPRQGRPVVDTDSVRVVARRLPGIQLDKVASPAVYAKAGELITYTYTVTDTGTVTLRHVTLTDDKLGPITCPKSVLAPGQSMTCQGKHTTTQADVDAGHIANSATVTGHPRKGRAVTGTATAVVTAIQHPRIALAKWAHPATYDRAGETITYTYRVTNTGNVTLHGIMVADNKIHGPIACPLPVLAPGQWMTCHAAHTTTKADVRAGHIRNAATAAGRPPAGAQVKAKAQAIVVRHTLPVVPVTG